MTFSDDAVVDWALNEIVAGLKRDAVVVDHTTTSPRGTIARYQRMANAGVRFVHAPVFMSPQMAHESIGLILSSAPRPTYDAVSGVLQQMTGEAWYLGDDPGRAAAYKLFGNSMIFVITAGMTDIFAMAGNLGIPASDALQVFTKFQPAGVIKGRGDKMAHRDFTASFELAMARKDVRLMLEAAGNRPLTVLPAIAKSMDEAITKGHGQDDLIAIAAEVVS
jgi:3-hydroxyisobutyrate dehydrogenase-like beta-hydroxyacid dehydrogenase